MKNALISSLVAAGILATASASAVASDGTITFTGNVESQTCTVSVNGGDSSATVTLPTVASSVLATEGETAGSTAFTISLTACTDTSGSVYAYFEQGANVDTTTGKLTNTGTATNVQVQLKDSVSNILNIGSDDQTTSPTTSGLSTDGSTTLSYSAEYYATGAATSGTVSTSVTYSISYI